MTEYDTLRLETVVQKPVVGIDDDGATHHFDAVRQTVYVVRGAEIERIQRLDGRSLSSWVDYVGTERGWGDLRYTERSFADQLVSVLGGA